MQQSNQIDYKDIADSLIDFYCDVYGVQEAIKFLNERCGCTKTQLIEMSFDIQDIEAELSHKTEVSYNALEYISEVYSMDKEKLYNQILPRIGFDGPAIKDIDAGVFTDDDMAIKCYEKMVQKIVQITRPEGYNEQIRVLERLGLNSVEIDEFL